jgi:hypothetical protein
MLADSTPATRSINGNLGAFRSMGNSEAYYTNRRIRERSGQRDTE